MRSLHQICKEYALSHKSKKKISYCVDWRPNTDKSKRVYYSVSDAWLGKLHMDSLDIQKGKFPAKSNNYFYSSRCGHWHCGHKGLRDIGYRKVPIGYVVIPALRHCLLENINEILDIMMENRPTPEEVRKMKNNFMVSSFMGV